MSLPLRLLLAVLPIPALFTAFSLWWLFERQAQSLLNQQRLRAQTMAASLASNAVLAWESGDRALLQTSLNALFLEPDVVAVALVDPQGRILAHHDPTRAGQIWTREHPDSLSVESQMGERGRVLLELSLDSYRHSLRRGRSQVAGLSALLLSVTLGMIGALAYRITLPLLILGSTARAIAAGDLEVEEVQARVQRGRLAELAALRAAFRELSARLAAGLRGEQQQHEHLKEEVNELLSYQESIVEGRPCSVPATTTSELAQVAEGLQQLGRALAAQAHLEQQYHQQRSSYREALRATHARLLESDHYKNEFLSVVSHELRTPLTSIKAFAEILLDMTPRDPVERAEFTRIIYRESDRLARIINHLLDISRIESGKMRWQTRRFALLDWLEGRLAAFRESHPDFQLEGPRAEQRKSLPDWALPPWARSGRPEAWRDGFVECDPERLEEVLEALLDNAARYSPSAQVRLHASKGTLRIEVRDQGPGVDPEHQELIFSKFQKMRLGDHRGGTGLSLALGRALLEAQGGGLHIESDGRQGSTLVITLPEARP